EGGEAPGDTIQLAYDAVSESYRPTNPDGSLGKTPNTAQYNRVTGTSSASGSLSAPSAGTPLVGLSFVDSGVTTPELVVQSYSWGGVGTASLQKFSLTLAPTSAEAGLWGHLAVGSRLDSATIHVRNGNSDEYLTYTLTGVTIASFSTSGDGLGNPP